MKISEISWKLWRNPHTPWWVWPWWAWHYSQLKAVTAIAVLAGVVYLWVLLR